MTDNLSSQIARMTDNSPSSSPGSPRSLTPTLSFTPASPPTCPNAPKLKLLGTAHYHGMPVPGTNNTVVRRLNLENVQSDSDQVPGSN